MSATTNTIHPPAPTQAELDQMLALYQRYRDPGEFIPNALMIPNRAGQIVPFVLKKAQARFVKQVKAQRSRGVPVRQIVGKTRRIGISSVIAALIFLQLISEEGQGAFTLAHELGAAGKQFGYFDAYRANYRPFLSIAMPPLLSRQQSEGAGALRFANRSSVEIATASNVNFARSFDIRLLQLAEYAYYQNIKALMDSLIPTVPHDSDTMIFKESTGNGYNEFFYEAEAAQEGRGDYEFFFAGCFEDEANVRPLPAEVYPDRWRESMSEVEWALLERYDLSLEQINWRRWCLNEFQGDEDRFDQEYPHSWEAAIKATGKQRFDPRWFVWMPTDNPGERGNVEKQQTLTGERYVFVPHSKGALTLWKRFTHQTRGYIGGVDVAKGVDLVNEKAGHNDPDYCAAIVGNRDLGEEILELHARLEPSVYAQYLFDIGAWCFQETGDWVYWVVEVEFSGGNGRAVLVEMLRLGYPSDRIYYHEKLDEGSKKVTRHPGFEIRPNTRPFLLTNFERYVLQKSVIFRSAKLLKEIRTFVRKANKIEHETGAHDDLLFAAMYFCWGLDAAPELRPKPKPTEVQVPRFYGARVRLTAADKERIEREGLRAAAERSARQVLATGGLR